MIGGGGVCRLCEEWLLQVLTWKQCKPLLHPTSATPPPMSEGAAIIKQDVFQCLQHSNVNFSRVDHKQTAPKTRVVQSCWSWCYSITVTTLTKPGECKQKSCADNSVFHSHFNQFSCTPCTTASLLVRYFCTCEVTIKMKVTSPHTNKGVRQTVTETVVQRTEEIREVNQKNMLGCRETTIYGLKSVNEEVDAV